MIEDIDRISFVSFAYDVMSLAISPFTNHLSLWPMLIIGYRYVMIDKDRVKKTW